MRLPVQEVFSLKKTADHPVHCVCCGKEVLAEIKDSSVVIKARRHGRDHVAVVPLDTKDDKSKINTES